MQQLTAMKNAIGRLSACKRRHLTFLSTAYGNMKNCLLHSEQPPHGIQKHAIRPQINVFPSWKTWPNAALKGYFTDYGRHFPTDVLNSTYTFLQSMCHAVNIIRHEKPRLPYMPYAVGRHGKWTILNENKNSFIALLFCVSVCLHYLCMTRKIQTQ